MVDCYGEKPRLLPSEVMTETNMPKIPRVLEGHYHSMVNACIAGYGNATTVHLNMPDRLLKVFLWKSGYPQLEP
jgi:hypothetical protein